MINKYFMKAGLVVGAFAIVMAIPAVVGAQTPSTDGDSVNAAITVPSTGGDNTNAAVVSPSTAGGDTNAAVGNSSTGTTPPTGSVDGDDTNAAVATPAVTPVTPVTPSGGGGTSYSSSGSYYSGGSSGSSVLVPQILVANLGTSTCPLITTYLAAGRNNPVSEVAKLQSFLKNSQGFNVALTGVYDEQTQNAVSQFQSKFVSDVMGPWGVTSPTGNVYITTKNKINQLACNKPFVLSESDQAIIDAYKTRTMSNQTSSQPTVDSGSNSAGPVLETGSGASSTNSMEVGTNAGESQTASVVNPSIVGRFWNFVVGLFK